MAKDKKTEAQDLSATASAPDAPSPEEQAEGERVAAEALANASALMEKAVEAAAAEQAAIAQKAYLESKQAELDELEKFAAVGRAAAAANPGLQAAAAQQAINAIKARAAEVTAPRTVRGEAGDIPAFCVKDCSQARLGPRSYALKAGTIIMMHPDHVGELQEKGWVLPVPR